MANESAFDGLNCEVEDVNRLLLEMERDQFSIREATEAIEKQEELAHYYQELCQGFSWYGNQIAQYISSGVIAYLQCIATCSRDKKIPVIPDGSGTRVVKHVDILGGEKFMSVMRKILELNPGISYFIDTWKNGCPTPENGRVDVCRDRIVSALILLHCLVGYANGFELDFTWQEYADYDRGQQEALKRRMSGGNPF